MRVIRCNNGHFYNGDASAVCPICIKKDQLKTELSEDNVQLPKLKSEPIPGLIPFVPVNINPDFLTLPQELEGLNIVGKIGSGSIGNVYHIQKHIDYAVKAIEWKSEKIHKMAINEYISAKMFKHKNVLSYNGYYEKDNHSYLLMEKATPWVEFCYREAEVTVSDVLYAVSCVCDALTVIHSKGYQHFDIKPSNIFMGNDEVIKLGDFSHSFAITKGKCFKQKIGTYQFMAPEIYDSRVCSGKEDIYSLGVTLYMMLTGGKLPFDFKDREPAVRSKDDRIRNFFLNSEISSIIEKATDYDPDARYQSVHEFKDALYRFANENTDMINTAVPFNWRASSSGTVFVHYSTKATMGTFIMNEQDTEKELDCRTVGLWFPPEEKGGNQNKNVENDNESKNDKKNNVSEDDDTAKNIKIDEVQFAVVAEKEIESDDIGIIEIGMFTNDFKNEVLDKLSKEFSGEITQIVSEFLYIREQSEITINLHGSGIDIEENSISHRWNGKYLKFSFDYSVPEDFKKKRILFKADIYFEGIIATTLKFIVNVNSPTKDVKKIERSDVHSAYISYARENISEVTYLLQAIRKTRPDMDIFFDVENLRSGDNWEERLYSELLCKDKLFLCWSHFAAASEWVKREWMYMLENKGLEAIEPFPLEDTHKCPVPDKLRSLHFNDVELMIRNSYSLRELTKS